MTWSSKALSQILIQPEVTFNVAPVTSAIAAIKIPFYSCDVKIDQGPQQSTLLGGGRHALRPFYGNKPITGTIRGPIDLQAIGHILRNIFGAPTTIGSVAPYTHTFKIGDSTPSFVLDKGFGDIDHYYLYTGCKATGLAFTFNQTGQPEYNLTFIGAKETHSTSPYQATPSTDYSRPVINFDIQDVSAMSEGGGSIDTLDEVSFNFMNNSVMGFGLGSSGEGTLACEGSPSIDGRIKGMFDADTIIAKGRDKTESSLALTLTSGVYSLVLSVNELVYSQQSPMADGPGGAYLDLSYVGYYQDDADASELKAVLVNTIASYA